MRMLNSKYAFFIWAFGIVCAYQIKKIALDAFLHI